MGNEIADRVAFFLKDYPPFSFLGYSELEEAAEEIVVRFLNEGEHLFQVGENGKPFCYVLRRGSIKLTQSQEGQEILIDQCEEGDVLGVRSLLTGNPYVISATCQSSTLVYEWPKSLFDRHLKNNAQFAHFFASGYAAGQAVVRDKKQSDLPTLSNIGKQSLSFSKQVITCPPTCSLQEAAAIMNEHGVGSIVIVNDEGHPRGILTDTDFRKKVVAVNLPNGTEVSRVMSSPVYTLPTSVTYEEAVIQMIRKRVHHLVLTADGTDQTSLQGLVSDHDLMISQKDQPAALVKSLRKETSIVAIARIRDQAEELIGQLISSDLSIALVSNFATEINDLLIEKAIDSALEAVPEARKIPFCWLSLGSEGREEQLLRTDQDNAILFADSREDDHRQKTLLKVAEKVNQVLLDCGFIECPAEIMARNPNYCRSLQSWEHYFSQWIQSPDPKALMNSTIFFDFRSAWGGESLTQQLRSFLSEMINKKEIFLNHLAGNAIQNPPPLGFFKQFLVEKGGTHNNEFDIKKRAMMPLSDAARVLCLQYGILDIQNTTNRFKKLSEVDGKNKELYLECGEAYGILMKIRAKYGLKYQSDGRFLDMAQMNKLEKHLLKSTFIPIKEIQRLLEVRYQLAYFR